jgi:hypothetical protein
MRKGLIFLQALVTACVTSGYWQNAEPKRRELAEISIGEFRDTCWFNISVFGCYVNMPADELKKREMQFDLTSRLLMPNAVSFFPANAQQQEGNTGVTAFVKDGKLTWILLEATTNMDAPGTPQTSYIKRMKPELRLLFEKYNATQWKQMFGEPGKFIVADTAWFHDYVYDFRSIGLGLRTFSFSPDWREQIAEFYIYDPGGHIPESISEHTKK